MHLKQLADLITRYVTSFEFYDSEFELAGCYLQFASPVFGL